MPDLGWVFFLNFSVCAGDTKDEALTKWNKMIREDEARYHWYQAAAMAVVEAAAEAVVKAEGEAVFEHALHIARSSRGDAERAVIEAAKALHAAMIQSYDGEPVPLAVMVEFKTAIEALQEVEGGL